VDAAMDPALATVLAAIPAWEGSEPLVTPITIGITNRNFRVDIAGESFVVRLSGKDTDLLGIDRAAENAAASAAAEAGVAPEVFAFLPELGALITRFVEGAHIPEKDLQRESVLRPVVSSIKAIHAGGPIPSAFPVFRIVEDYREIAAERGVAVPPAFDEVHAKANEIEAAFAKHPLPDRPCHNDLLNANFLDDGEIRIVDWEYAGMGDRFFDLANFSVNHEFEVEDDGRLLAAYFGQERESDLAALRLMRFMSDFREAMWGVLQSGISELDFDFKGYASKHFERLERTAAEPEFAGYLSVVG
jgi:thiamine kinase-like enzyme